MLPTESLPDLSCSYSTALIDDILQKDNLLAVISFGKECAPGTTPRHLPCGLQPLEDPMIKEVWRVDTPVNSGIDLGCSWSETEGLLVTAIWIDEKKYPDFRTAVYDSYQHLLQFIATKGYPHIIRIWNFMADINLGTGDNEKYKQFCEGRYQAFVNNAHQLSHLPSASALGHTGSNTIIYLIAAKHPGLNFENPQQMSAYHYPREYGPQSPSFARATLADWGNRRQLFISGTASIIGHQSIHANNFDAQLEVICQNIDSLLTHVVEQSGSTHTPQIDVLKVYLRNRQDLGEAKTGIAKHFGEGIPVLFLQADVCRRELLMEIEGLYKL